MKECLLTVSLEYGLNSRIHQTLNLIHYKLNSVASDKASDLPQKLEVVQIGDISVFLTKNEWKIGKILQFYYQSGKTQNSQQCKETSINLTTVKILVLCVLGLAGTPLSLQTYSLSSDDKTTSYSSSVSDYAFTLSDKCFRLVQGEELLDVTQGVLLKDAAKIQLA